MSDDDWEFKNKDHKCFICDKWTHNHDELDEKFRCCKSCPQVFHKRCIPPYFRECEDDHNCNTIFRNEAIKHQCSNPRDPNIMIQIPDGIKLYGKRNYIYKPFTERAIYWYPSDHNKGREIKRKYRPETYAFISIFNPSKSQTRLFPYKYLEFTKAQNAENASIKESNIPWEILSNCEMIWMPMDIAPMYVTLCHDLYFLFCCSANLLIIIKFYHAQLAMIREIQIYDEPNAEPNITVFWYWRQSELSDHLLDAKNLAVELKGALEGEDDDKWGERHLYLDYQFSEDDNQSRTYSIEAIIHKVRMFDTLQELEANEEKECNGYYSDYVYADPEEKFTKLQHSLFAKMTMEMAKEDEKGHFIGNDIEEIRNLWKHRFDAISPQKKPRSPSISNHDEIPATLVVPNNENDHQIMHLLHKTSIMAMEEENNKSGKHEEVALQERWNRILKQMEHDRNLYVDEEKEMEDICDVLGIEGGPKNNIRLYGFKRFDHIGVYRLVWCLVSKFWKKEADQIVWQMNGNELRDIKVKIYSSGQLGQQMSMRFGISNKLDEMRRNHIDWVKRHRRLPNVYEKVVNVCENSYY